MKPSELSGLIPDDVGEELASLAGDVRADRAIVEIGSYKGKSTCYLASGVQGASGVWAVDPWDSDGNVTGRFGFASPETRRAFERQIAAAGFSGLITPIRGFSTEVAKEWAGPPIGLLYIDGDHSEAAVRADFEAWRPHLEEGSTVAFDDLDTPRNPGVRAVVDELVASGVLVDFHVRAQRLAVGVFIDG